MEVDEFDVCYLPRRASPNSMYTPGYRLTIDGRETLRNAMKLELEARKAFGPFGRGALTIRVPDSDWDKLNAAQQKMSESVKRAENSEQSLLMYPDEWDVGTLQPPPQVRDFLSQQRTESVRDIGRIVGLPPILLADPGVGAPSDSTVRQRYGAALSMITDPIGEGLTAKIFPRGNWVIPV